MKLRPVNLDQLRKIRDGTGHSIYGPSSSGMYLNCAGSLIANLLAPDNAGPDAAYGTVAHGLCELWGKTGKRPDHRIGGNEFVESGEWGYLIHIDEEMMEYVQMCMDWVEWLPGEFFWERRVDFSRITPIPNQTGTADLIIRQGTRLIVVDWKFGKGVRVFAKNNTQGMLYALGALWEFDIDDSITEIEIRIGQPRLDHFDVWVVSRDELMLFAGWAKARMALAWQHNAPRVAGVKQCEFCRINTSCAANAKMQVELSEGYFDNMESEHPISAEEMQEFKDRLDDDLVPFDIDFTQVGTLTTEQLARLLPYRRAADKWWKKIDIELLHRTVDGEDLTPYDWKVVEARSRRAFRNVDATVAKLEILGVPREKSIEEKLVSPAEAERLLMKAGHRRKDVPSLLEDLTIKPKGKPTLARLSDKRPTLVDITEGSFDNLESETSEIEEEY